MEKERFFLLYSLKSDGTFNTISILDSKLKRVYCGSPIDSDSVSLKEYGSSINTDKKIPITKAKFLKIRKESYIELRKTNYLSFFDKYNLQEWLL